MWFSFPSLGKLFRKSEGRDNWAEHISQLVASIFEKNFGFQRVSCGRSEKLSKGELLWLLSMEEFHVRNIHFGNFIYVLHYVKQRAKTNNKILATWERVRRNQKWKLNENISMTTFGWEFSRSVSSKAFMENFSSSENILTKHFHWRRSSFTDKNRLTVSSKTCFAWNSRRLETSAVFLPWRS